VKVRVPFKKEFKDVMLQGTKTMTSRTRKYSKTGDTFEAFGAAFRILYIIEMQLEEVVEHWYEEGCRSKEEFVNVWNRIHPLKGYDPEQWVWVHFFEKVKEPCSSE